MTNANEFGPDLLAKKKPVAVKVTDLYVQCALKVRHLNDPGIAMSDCCQKPATSAVVMENGVRMWRCAEHTGVRRIHPVREMGSYVLVVYRESDRA